MVIWLLCGVLCGLFVWRGFVGERFVIEAVLKLAVKNDALLPDKLFIHALVDESVV